MKEQKNAMTICASQTPSVSATRLESTRMIFATTASRRPKLHGKILLFFVAIVALNSINLAHRYVNQTRIAENTGLPSHSLSPKKRINSHNGSPALRFDWTNLKPISPLARKIDEVQSQCLQPAAPKKPQKVLSAKMPISGMGSSLHSWMGILCHATEQESILLTNGDRMGWTWNDQALCPALISDMSQKLAKDRLLGNRTFAPRKSPLWCYFGHHESGLQCPKNTINLQSAPSTDFRERNLCPNLRERYGWPTIRAASAEWLFQNVSKVVIDEAERRIREEAFPDWGRVPSNLITVHIRWSDKKKEMRLAHISEYVEATNTLLTDSERTGKERVNIFVVSEDSSAIGSFINATKDYDWNVYTSTSSTPSTHLSMQSMASETKGRAGLESLATLLIAMEANRYVLTLASNWSRLMNELRKNIVNPRCGNCTNMVDLRPFNENDENVDCDPGRVCINSIQFKSRQRTKGIQKLL